MDDTSRIIIEQKLEAPGRLLFFTADDAAAFLLPVAVGFLSRHLIVGFVIGGIVFAAWRRLKGGITMDSGCAIDTMPPVEIPG